MKKIYLYIPFLFAAIVSNAQLTQSNHAPAAGDSYQHWQCDSVAPGNAGQNMTWNFSTLKTHSSVVHSFTTGASTNTLYSAATVSVAASANNVSYFSSSTSSLSYHGGNISVGAGLTAVIATLNYTTPAVRASYPMAYNTSTSAAIGGSLNITAPLPTSGTFSGTSSVIADGTGTLILPGATGIFTNVIRIVSTQTINFNTTLSAGSIVQTLSEYYMNGIKSPIFSVATATATIPLGGGSQTLVTRDKNAVGISAAPINTTSILQAEINNQVLSVFPNPASSTVNFISNSDQASEVVVYDITGKLVDQLTLADGKAKLNVTHFNKGLYIYKLLAADGKSLRTGKFTVSD